ncbi:MAG TPA: hypothetical protein VEL31_27485 [Ktedonobacteraceae bacterium]|nr:hypothetical protein [Ktedonobacteraceae bacterium]
MSCVRTEKTEGIKCVGPSRPLSLYLLGHQHHDLQSVQPVAESLALLNEGNALLHRHADPKELTHLIESATEA